MMHRSVTRSVGPFVRMPSSRRSRPVRPWPSVVRKSSCLTKLRAPCRMTMKICPAAGGDLGGAAAARQAHLGLRVVADDGAVQVAEAVHLRASQKSDGDPAALQPVAEYLRHRDRGQRRLAQLAVADRERQHVGPRAERARFVDQVDARRVRQPRQVARRRRQPDADEADVVVADSARAAATVIISAGV